MSKLTAAEQLRLTIAFEAGRSWALDRALDIARGAEDQSTVVSERIADVQLASIDLSISHVDDLVEAEGQEAADAVASYVMELTDAAGRRVADETATQAAPDGVLSISGSGISRVVADGRAGDDEGASHVAAVLRAFGIDIESIAQDEHGVVSGVATINPCGKCPSCLARKAAEEAEQKKAN